MTSSIMPPSSSPVPRMTAFLMLSEGMEIQGIGSLMVGQIQDAVNQYYGQFEDSPGGEGLEPAMPEPLVEEAHLGALEEPAAEAAEETAAGVAAGASFDAEGGPGGEPEEIAETSHPEGALSLPESGDSTIGTEADQVAASEIAEQFGTIENGSPTHSQSEGAGPEGSGSGAGSPDSGR